VQIIESKRLDAGENIWLRSLRKGLGVEEAEGLLQAIARKAKAQEISSYMDLLFRVNKKTFTEVEKMKYPTAVEVLEGTIMGKMIEAKATAAILKLVRQGLSADEIEKRLAKRNAKRQPKAPPTSATP
jgi:hypothetical protein